MTRHLSKIAAALLVLAVAILIMRSLAPHHDPRTAGAGADVSPPSRTDPRRLSLEDALPKGSIITRDSGTGGLRVDLPDGSHLTAAGASVTDSGVTFKSPYRVERPSMLPMSCSDGETNLVLSSDGKTFKSIGRSEWNGEFGIDFDY
jgi:hypothetical protein